MALKESSRNPRVAWTSDITEAALAQRSAGDGHERPERHQSCSGDVGGRRSSIGPRGSWPSALPRAHAFSRHIQVRRRKRVGGPKGHKAPAGESVAATATTNISSTTTSDRTIKGGSSTSGSNLLRSGPSSLPSSRSSSHRLISHPLRRPRWRLRRRRCRRGSSRPYPAADTQASRWRGRSPALATTGGTKMRRRSLQ